MGRKKKNSYNRTVFAERIEKLQLSRGYSSEYVLEHLKDDNEIPIINDRQVLDSYLSGKRKPRDFDVALKAFAKFYDVTTDYLLGADDVPNRQIQSVQDFTGLSDDAIRRLTQLKDQYPDILAMVDAIIAGTAAEDIADYVTLYNQIYSDYRDSRQPDKEVKGLLSEMDTVQRRFFLTQTLYNYWQRIVTAKLAPSFDKEMLMEADRNQYEHSQEFFDTIPDSDPPEQAFTQVEEGSDK